MHMLVLSQTIVKYLYTAYVYCGNICFKKQKFISQCVTNPLAEELDAPSLVHSLACSASASSAADLLNRLLDHPSMERLFQVIFYIGTIYSTKRT